MKKFTKMMALGLAVLLLIGMMSGCAGSSAGENSNDSTNTSNASTPVETQAETLDEVTLTMYLLGDRTADFDLVFEKINEKMKEKINATIEVKFMGWGEYEQKYPLVFASGEEFDLIYSADWAMYNSQASKQGFYEITEEMLQTYAPLTAETMYEDAWEQAKVNGKVYMLPMNYKELTAYVFFVRGDLMDKYGIEKVETMEDVEAYLDAIAQNESSMIPLDVGSDFDDRFLFDLFWQSETADRLEKINPEQLMGYTTSGDDSATVFNETEDPVFLATVQKLQDWKNRGFWSKSAVVNT